MSKQFEGTWEEVSANASESIGHRVHVTLVEDETVRGQRVGGANQPKTPEPKTIDPIRSVMPGRNHCKLFKNWSPDIGATAISLNEFDAFDLAIAENRAMRRKIAQDSND